MPLNPYFNFWSQTNDQTLMESLLIESIKIYGVDAYYIPRNIIELNEVLGEEIRWDFTNSYLIEIYLKNVSGFDGRKDFLSKFGLEIRDEVQFTVAQSRFKSITSMNRPLEGDIIYLPYPMDTFFQIKFVEHEDMFYELGNLKVYNLTCEKYEYNHDLVNTGNTIIDSFLEANNSYTVQLSLENGTGNYVNGESVYQGTSLANAICIGEVFDWVSNVITLGNITAEFTPNTLIIGNTSNSQWY